MKVLIADDQASVHQFLAKAINWSFYGITAVISAYNGREALDQAMLHQPELIILDIKMPVMTGLELLPELKRRNLGPKIIILSAYNEFEYAREAMKFGVKNYLLKPIDPQKLGDAVAGLVGEKQEELKSAAGLAIAGLLQKKQSAVQTGLPELANLFQSQGIERYLCAVIDSCAESPVYPELLDFNEVEFAAWLTLETAPGEYLMILPLSAAQPEVTVCRNFGRLIGAWNQNHPEIPLVAGFSESAAAAARIPELFQQAKQAAQLRFYQDGPLFFHSNSLFSPKKKDPQLDTIQKNLLESIRMNLTEAKVAEQLQQFFAYFRVGKVLPDLVFQACYDLMLLIIANDNVFSGMMAETDFSIAAYRDFPSLDTLEAAFTQTVLDLIRQTRPPSGKSEAGLVREIKSFMENNYSADLSLDALAKKFYVSKYQICRMFKKETGVNYWDYVTRIRMEKALYLLMNTALKNYEIAARVGYDDICHFSTLFKKYYGKSPKEYRKATP